MDFSVSTTSNQQGPPPSPPRMGFVAGADTAGEMNGYVGGKPAKREDPSQPRQRATPVNLASPDPSLAQSAFTQSQFTQSISAAQTVESTADKRLENLRRYKQGNGGGGGCALPNRFGRNNLARQQQAPARQAEPVVTPPVVEQKSYVAYTLSDPGYMYKAFSGSTTWFRVAQLIVPEGKIPQRVYASAMLVKEGESESTSYSLRLVDPAESPAKTLWAEYSAQNTDNFEVYKMDITSPTSQLLEIQAQHSTGDPILVSSIIMEFQ